MSLPLTGSVAALAISGVVLACSGQTLSQALPEHSTVQFQPLPPLTWTLEGMAKGETAVGSGVAVVQKMLQGVFTN